NGGCQCNAISCLGCCIGNQCFAGNTQNVCGRDGGTCQSCQQTQTCTNNTCTGPTDGGVCNITTCNNGCCLNGTCTTRTVQNCGAAGSICMACDAFRADSCQFGQCRCGNNNLCQQGQQCVNGN